MGEEEDRRVFAIIRPYCVKLSQLALAPDGIFDPNSLGVTEALKDVYTHFQDAADSDTVLSTNLADYIFMPLSHLLKHPKLGDTQTIYLLRILALIVRHCWTRTGSIPYVLARQLFPLITFLTGGAPNPKDNSEINAKSDELKQAGAETLNYFFKSLVAQKESKLYDFFGNVENLPPLGHAATVLLECSLNGKSIELQLRSLEALNTLYTELINDGEVLSYILPGNVSTLTKIVASKGSKTHYTVIVKALDLLSDLLVLVYEDDSLDIDYKEVESVEQILENPDLEKIALREDGFHKIHRTNSWLKGTSNQVKLALENVKKGHQNSRIEVKKSLYRLARSLLDSCLFSLNSSIPIAVEILAYLSNEERLNITSNLLETKDPKRRQFLQSVISSELNNYVDTFASVIQSPNEDKIISSINAIKFTATRSSNAFLVSKLAESCLNELSESLRKSQSKTKVIEASSTDTTNLMLISNDASRLTVESKSLTVFDKAISKEVQLELASMFQSLGSTIDPSEIIEEILSENLKTLNERSVGLWIANNLMQGYVSKVKPKLIANEFLSFDDEDDEDLVLTQKPEFVYSILDCSKDILDEVSELEPTEEVVQANSVALDTISVVQTLMRHDFKEELIDYLYPVIDSMASPSGIVREHALNTSLIIADELYSGSLYQLILDNSDYLIDSISIRLSNAMTTRSTAILAVCTKIAGFKIIETFKDVIEIIFSLLDHYHGYEDLCIGFFIFFEIVVDEIKKRYMSDYGYDKLEYHSSSSSYAPWGMTTVDELVSLLDRKNMQIDPLTEPPVAEGEEDVEDEINKPDSDDEDDAAEEPREVPTEKKQWTSPIPEDAYRLLQQIVYYGERLLTHPSTQLKIRILRVYYKTIPIFATERDNLFPIVASIWPIVSVMVNSSDAKVALPASEVMTEILDFSGDFVSRRFVDFWSQLKHNQLLISGSKQASQSQKVVLPGINSKCYESLVDMLVMGLNRLDRYIPDSVAEEIIRSFIGVVEVERFEMHSDIAWYLKKQLYGVASAERAPDDVLIDGEVFKFVKFN